VKQIRLCSVDGCSRPTTARRLCAKHYEQARQRGDFGNAKRERFDRELHIYFSEPLKGKLEAYAESQGRAVSATARAIIAGFFKYQEKKEKST
jgi:hypothetical protein